MPQLIVTRRTLISANKIHVLINRIRNTSLLARRAIVRVERYRFHNRRHTFTPHFARFVDNLPRLPPHRMKHLAHGGTTKWCRRCVRRDLFRPAGLRNFPRFFEERGQLTRERYPLPVEQGAAGGRWTVPLEWCAALPPRFPCASRRFPCAFPLLN